MKPAGFRTSDTGIVSQVSTRSISYERQMPIAGLWLGNGHLPQAKKGKPLTNTVTPSASSCAGTRCAFSHFDKLNMVEYINNPDCWIDIGLFARREESINICCSFGSIMTSGEGVIFTAYRNGSDGIFDQVIIYFDTPIDKYKLHIFPTFQGISDCFSDLTSGCRLVDVVV